MISIPHFPLTQVKKACCFSMQVDCRESHCGASNQVAVLTRQCSNGPYFALTSLLRRKQLKKTVNEREAGIPQELGCLISAL